jgi:hypothetical protein
VRETVERGRWRAKLVKYGENGRRKGRIEYDRQVCKYRLPQLAKDGVKVGRLCPILSSSSEARTYRIQLQFALVKPRHKHDGGCTTTE